MMKMMTQDRQCMDEWLATRTFLKIKKRGNYLEGVIAAHGMEGAAKIVPLRHRQVILYLFLVSYIFFILQLSFPMTQREEANIMRKPINRTTQNIQNNVQKDQHTHHKFRTSFL